MRTRRQDGGYALRLARCGRSRSAAKPSSGRGRRAESVCGASAGHRRGSDRQSDSRCPHRRPPGGRACARPQGGMSSSRRCGRRRPGKSSRGLLFDGRHGIMNNEYGCALRAVSPAAGKFREKEKNHCRIPSILFWRASALPRLPLSAGVCCPPRWRPRTCALTAAGVLLGILALQAGLLLAGQDGTLVLTLLPLTAYLPAVAGGMCCRARALRRPSRSGAPGR